MGYAVSLQGVQYVDVREILYIYSKSVSVVAKRKKRVSNHETYKPRREDTEKTTRRLEVRKRTKQVAVAD